MQIEIREFLAIPTLRKIKLLDLVRSLVIIRSLKALLFNQALYGKNSSFRYLTATAAIFPSGWAAFNSGFHRLLWHGENLRLQSQTGCQIQGNLSDQLEVKNFINPTEKTVRLSHWLFLPILGQAV